MTVLFKAKTNEGYTFKILSELLQNIVRIACLEVDQNGIRMRMMDSHRRVLLDINLESINFNIYEFNAENTLYLGLNLNHLYKMLKIIKKKDALMLTINSADPNQLNLVIYPKENNRISTSCIRIQSIQHINVPLPSGYTNSVIVPSNEYQRTLKDMNNIADTLVIKMKKYSLTIYSTAQGIYSREVLFGELDDSTPVQYTEYFEMEQFVRIVKIAGLAKNLQIFSGNSQLPLLITSKIGQVGHLGTISIYIKSKEQVKRDEHSES
jgi:proliferating cell nuclear antigen PCNA